MLRILKESKTYEFFIGLRCMEVNHVNFLIAQPDTK